VLAKKQLPMLLACGQGQHHMKNQCFQRKSSAIGQPCIAGKSRSLFLSLVLSSEV
jgi:hypothetical protein